VTGAADRDRLARVALSCLADPGDPALRMLLRSLAPAEIVESIRAGALPPRWRPPRPDAEGARNPDLGDGTGKAGGSHPDRELARALARWAARLDAIPTTEQIALQERDGIRAVCPGDPDWPEERLAALGDAAPVMLWVRGSADLGLACRRSASIVGARAATGYGRHVATELSAALAERGVAVISGGAYGVDACAHQGALAADGLTFAVLASGLSYGYPRGNQGLFAAIAAQGAVISELPPDRGPTRPGFLIRNRVIAALGQGTVVVEAALRSGALNTARHAAELSRPLMAVPGPVTSAASAGCHELIRELGATLVTSAADVLEMIAPAGEELLAPRWGPPTARDSLQPEALSVLEAVPAAGGGPAVIAVRAGVGLDAALRSLGMLAAAGFVERCPRGWRVRTAGRHGADG
jgi:DNA processing protein